jgi:VWFA-related protein
MNARWVLLLVAASAVTVTVTAQGPQRFSARVDIVRLDVLVSDRGKPLVGLSGEDFEIEDNGVRQQVDIATYEQIPINAILAFDMSRSVAGEKLTHLREAGRALLGALKPKDQAALVGFSQAVVVGPRLTTDLSLIHAALNRATGGGSTSLVDACFSALMLGESDIGRTLVLVFSDGLDTSSWLTPAEVLDTAKRSDGVVYGFSIKNAPRTSFLRDISSTTGGETFEIESARSLGGRFLNVLEEFRLRYLVSYTPRGVSRNGWHKIDVRVRGRNVTVKVRPGYLAGS